MTLWFGSGAVLVALFALVAGCSTVSPPSASAMPASRAPAFGAKPLILMATSGPFTRPAERTDVVQADIVIWADGLVAVNVGERLSPNYRAVQLTPEDADRLADLIAAPDLQSISAASASYGACIDCPVKILRVDISGRSVELATRGAVATSEYRYSTEYPDSLLQLHAILDQFAEKVRQSSESAEPRRPIPQVPVAPRSGG